MKELNRTRRLTIATFIFVLIILVGFITLRTPEYVYQITSGQMLNDLFDMDQQVSPEQMKKLLAPGRSDYILVDVRNPNEYDKGYLGEALNIPVSEILENESLSFFGEKQKDSVQVILYGNNQLEANGAWMLLRQLGFENIKILLGGYAYMSAGDKDLLKTSEIPTYRVEEPLYNFAGVVQNDSVNVVDNTQLTETVKQITPVKRNKKNITSGGC